MRKTALVMVLIGVLLAMVVALRNVAFNGGGKIVAERNSPQLAIRDGDYSGSQR